MKEEKHQNNGSERMREADLSPGVVGYPTQPMPSTMYCSAGSNFLGGKMMVVAKLLMYWQGCKMVQPDSFQFSWCFTSTSLHEACTSWTSRKYPIWAKQPNLGYFHFPIEQETGRRNANLRVASERASSTIRNQSITSSPASAATMQRPGRTAIL